MKLIVEDTQDAIERGLLVDNSTRHDDGFRPYNFRGTFIVANRLNRNNRMYDFDELRPEVDKFIENSVATKRAFGDFEHPTDSKVDRSRAAIKVTELDLVPEERLWKGVATLMYSDPEHGRRGTPAGDLAKSFIDYDTPMGMSTRGVGEIVGEMVRNYHLITVDLVCEPSINEFCEGVLESKEFMVDMHGQIVECALGEYERMVDATTKTYDMAKRREILSSAWAKLLAKI